MEIINRIPDELKPSIAEYLLGFKFLECDGNRLTLGYKNSSGKLHGVFIVWINRKFVEVSNYDCGEKHGNKKCWFEDGQLEFENNYHHGKPHGNQKRWFENGQLQFEYNSYNGKQHGNQKYWFENGQLELEWNSYNGKQHGNQKYWFENGQLKLEENYEYGEKL
jgi:antitoxin component YwqK of YwqJK toxin-antitoxin module